MNKYYLIFLVFLCWACGNKSTQDYKVLRYNQTNHITSLDPAFAKSQNNIWATHHLFDGLVYLDKNLNIQSAIADHWKINEEGTSYTFYLRDDVFFHTDECFENGNRKVNAYDVKYSFERIIDDKVNSPGSWLLKDRLQPSNGLKVIDSLTFQINIKEPFIPMMGILGMQYFSIVPREGVERYGNKFRAHPVGTGPFRFKRWVQNQALFLEQNPDYFRDIPSNLDGIKTTFIPDRKIAYLELLRGNLDYVSGLESSFAGELLTTDGKLRKDKSDKIKFGKSPYLNFEYIGINYNNAPKHSPLRQKKFRQALNLAVDRNLMLSVLRNNVGVSANAGAVPRGLPSHNPDKVRGYTYNLDSARVLIQSLNLKDKPKIELYTNKDYLDLTTFIAKQWESIGVMTDIEVLESSILRDGMRKGNLSMFRASWIADYPDAESFLCLFYSKFPAPPNYTRYNNPEYDKLYEKAISESDNNKRYALYQEMDRMIVEDAPVIFLFYDETAQFISKRTNGLDNNAINLLTPYGITMK